LVHEGIAYCDCPGFGDSSGFEKDVINCVAIGKLLAQAQNVKLVIVLSYSSIVTLDGRGAGVQSMLRTITNLFVNDTPQVTDVDSLKRTLIVVNNAPLGTDSSVLANYA
jgi:hypothetical protein